jgi:hypothetical protein
MLPKHPHLARAWALDWIANTIGNADMDGFDPAPSDAQAAEIDAACAYLRSCAQMLRVEQAQVSAIYESVHKLVTPPGLDDEKEG